MIKNIESLLNIFNYFDGIIVTDKNGIINYYVNFRTDIYNLRLKQIIGKSILEIHPEIKEEDSTIMQVLKTGQPIYDRIEHLTTPHGDCMTNICSTLPILENGNIVGAIDLSRGIDTDVQRKFIEMPKVCNQSNSLYHVNDIVSASKKVNDLKSIISMVANTDSAVMICGETGTGKEMFAQSVHTSGARASKPFISQNCAAIPNTLLEGILFGTTKGSFTGAEDKAGLFEMANGGTLFLDEINSMDLGMQAKILKVIEEKRVRRIGSDNTVDLDLKIISATNKNPLLCVKDNILREDLFYRLSTVLMDIPPLRERIVDIPLLVNFFIEQNNNRMNKNVSGVTQEVMEVFLNYQWPGNVRELKNVIEGAFNVIGSSEIKKDDLPPYLLNNYSHQNERLISYGEDMSLPERLEEYEKRLLIQALDSTNNLTRAAEKLKITKQALNYKILKYGLRK
ncbi:MAG: sigma 54-interacting transcriptional regulator [Firmicutes bacterium]|nr:sigma 54-interacting transcriptional regulator [Bacillota bacterium]